MSFKYCRITFIVFILVDIILIVKYCSQLIKLSWLSSKTKPRAQSRDQRPGASQPVGLGLGLVDNRFLQQALTAGQTARLMTPEEQPQHLAAESPSFPYANTQQAIDSLLLRASH